MGQAVIISGLKPAECWDEQAGFLPIDTMARPMTCSLLLKTFCGLAVSYNGPCVDN